MLKANRKSRGPREKLNTNETPNACGMDSMSFDVNKKFSNRVSPSVANRSAKISLRKLRGFAEDRKNARKNA